ncbi:MAG: glutamate--tRNA ligase, partial [Bacteroidetes bacterium]
MPAPVVRFAPSPTGPLHIGGVRTALYNYLFARQQGGRCILRIEDTDQTRYVPGAEAYIIESLKWLGITFNEGVEEGGPAGPYRQSDRAKAGLYQQYAEQLLATGAAYYAFDTPEELDAMRERLRTANSSIQQYNAHTRDQMTNSLTLPPEAVERRLASGEPYVIRMKMPLAEDVVFEDVVRGTVSFNTRQLDDKVLLKSDGMPTYHLANVVDDHLMEVTHVIRGEEWLSSTPLHVLLYRALGWADTMPRFVHLPLILNPNGQGKLSKRQGDKMGFPVFPTVWTDPKSGSQAPGFREEGYLPEALINFLALLGWNPGDEEEVMDMARLTERFSLERIGSSGTKFDLDKLKWFNETYLRAMPTDSLRPLLAAELTAANRPVPEAAFLDGVIALMRERASFVADMVTEAPYLYQAPDSYDEKMAQKRWKGDVPGLMADLKAAWAALDSWDADSLHEAFQAFIQAREVGV